MSIEPRFTDHQRTIIRLVAEGKSNRDIARCLFISERTVKNHLTAIYIQLGFWMGANQRVLLARWWWEQGPEMARYRTALEHIVVSSPASPAGRLAWQEARQVLDGPKSAPERREDVA